MGSFDLGMRRSRIWEVMITLDQVLDGLTVDVQPFAICQARGDSVIDLGSQRHATLHYVLAGGGTFAINGFTDIASRDGTILIAPAHTGHHMRANRQARCDVLTCAPLDGGWHLHSEGCGDAGIIVACGEVAIGYRGIEGLFDYLQTPLVCNVARNAPLKVALDQMMEELSTPKVGSRPLARSLMHQCIIHILRDTSTTAPAALEWLAAAQDERVWRAVTAIFDHPEAPHSLETLAKVANMSRTSFAEHFKQTFDRGPIDLLKEVRLRRAASLLTSTDLSIKAISRDIGYRSRSYFSRAFHEQFGRSPARFRENSRRVGA